MDKNEIFKELTEYKNNKQYKKLLKCAKEAAETFNDNCFYNEIKRFFCMSFFSFFKVI